LCGWRGRVARLGIPPCLANKQQTHPIPQNNKPNQTRSTAFQIIDQKCGASAAPLLGASGEGPAAGERLTNPLVASVLRRLGKLGARDGARVRAQILFAFAYFQGFWAAVGVGEETQYILTRLFAHPPAQHNTTQRTKNTFNPGFYSGPVADAIVDAVQSRGGVLSHGDLAAHRTLEVEPVSTDYKGVTVWEVPPPCQGVVALMALNLLEADKAFASKVCVCTVCACCCCTLFVWGCLCVGGGRDEGLASATKACSSPQINPATKQQ
jgi:gamma-glutamyltranspeptidase